MLEKSRRPVFVTVGLCAALLLIPGAAYSFHPTGDCDAAQAAGQLSRASYVRATAVLERRESGEFATYMSSVDSFAAQRGDVLVHAPWSAPPSTGEVYRIRLETVIFDGLEETSPAEETLSSWPEAQTFRLSATGSPFTCEAARPVFNSSPATTTSTTSTYSYAPSVSQTGSNALHFTLLAGPDGMSIDDTFGDISWEASPAEAGRQRTIILLVEDATTHLADVQAYQVAVSN